MKYLWRKETEINSLCKTDNSIDSYVFPSGRQAIEFSLKDDDRVDRIAIPEYSSQCVINAVGSHTMPIPVREVLEHNISVKGILVYEQWGWSFEENVIDEITQKFDKVIFDCVDSPNAHVKYNNIDHPVIVSLSKCMGLKGGALISKNSTLQESNCAHDDCMGLDINNPDAIQMINNYMDTTRHIGNLSQIDILFELEKEAQTRNENLKLFADSSLSDHWEDWMFDAVSNNCSAGIVPLFRGKNMKQLQKINVEIQEKFNIKTEIYNFNWSGSPLILNYEPCIAFPVHGDINKISEILRLLERKR